MPEQTAQRRVTIVAGGDHLPIRQDQRCRDLPDKAQALRLTPRLPMIGRKTAVDFNRPFVLLQKGPQQRNHATIGQQIKARITKIEATVVIASHHDRRGKGATIILRNDQGGGVHPRWNATFNRHTDRTIRCHKGGTRHPDPA